jgi:hypothetical protein
LPHTSSIVDDITLIRSMSYTPNGLFNHTAAIYQMLTGYPPEDLILKPEFIRRAHDQQRHRGPCLIGRPSMASCNAKG